MNTRILRKKLRVLGHALIPSRWRLPLFFLWVKWKGDLEPEMFCIASLVNPATVAIDVGANRGLYSYALSRHFQRVEAFEANPRVVVDLISYKAPNVGVHQLGLSSAAGRASLHVPVSAVGAEYSGWGSLNRAALPDTPTVREIEVELATLDSFRIQNVGLIKIDVEGHEQEVLKGSVETIRQWRPVVLIEVKPQSRSFVVEYFLRINYQLHYLEGKKLKLLCINHRDNSWPRENVFAIPATRQAESAR